MKMHQFSLFFISILLVSCSTPTSHDLDEKGEKKISILSSIPELPNLTVKRSPLTTKALKQAIQLNYITISLTKINNYNDRIVLEQELDTILNNLDISQIEDKTIIDAYKDLIMLLKKQTLTESERMKLNFIYEHKMSNALEDAFNPANIIAGGLNPWTAIAETAGNLGGAVLDYRKKMKEYKHQLTLDDWKLDDDTFEQITTFREEFLGDSWKIIDKYKIDRDLRLTESQMEDYVEAIKDSNDERKYSRLINMMKNFKAYPPFWYNLGLAAQKLSKKKGDVKYKEALKCYQTFEKAYFGLLKYDNTYASLCMNRIILRGFEKNSQTMSDLKTIRENAPKDWNKLTFVASAYAKMGLDGMAEEVLKNNINDLSFSIETKNNNSKVYNEDNIEKTSPVDEGEELILTMNTQLLALLLKEKKDDKEIGKLLDKIIENESHKNFEALFLVGLISDERYLNRLKKELDKITVTFNYEDLGNDIAVVSIPNKWFLKINTILVYADDNAMSECSYKNGKYTKRVAWNWWFGAGTGVRYDDYHKLVQLKLHLEEDKVKNFIVVCFENSENLKIKLYFTPSRNGDGKTILKKINYLGKGFIEKNGKFVKEK